MAKSKGSFDMGSYTVNKHDLKAYVWCIRNNIFIYPVAIREARWTIEIKNKDNTSKDPNDYTKANIWAKVYEYYKYYYNKYNKDEK